MAQLCFENSHFNSSISSTLSALLNNSSYCHVTLVCKDGQLSAHRIILASSRSFFSSVFTHNPHPHPLMYVWEVKTHLMKSVRQFVYAEVTSVMEEDVTSCLALGDDLKIDVLVGRQHGSLKELNKEVE